MSRTRQDPPGDPGHTQDLRRLDWGWHSAQPEPGKRLKARQFLDREPSDRDRA